MSEMLDLIFEKNTVNDLSLGRIHGVLACDEEGPVAAATVTSRSLGKRRGRADVVIHVRPGSSFAYESDTMQDDCYALKGLCGCEAMSVPGLLHVQRALVTERLESVLRVQLAVRVIARMMR